MLVAPLAVTVYAIANNLRPAQFMEAMNEVGLVTGAANLVLLAVAGYVPSSRLDEPIPALRPSMRCSRRPVQLRNQLHVFADSPDSKDQLPLKRA